MFYRSKTIVYGRAFVGLMIASWKTVPSTPLLQTAAIHLFNNTPQLSPDSVPGDFTETNFSGYNPVATPATSPPNNLDPETEGLVINAMFQSTPGSPFVQDNITGYYCWQGGGIFFAELFPQSIPIASYGDFLDLTVVLPLPCIIQNPLP